MNFRGRASSPLRAAGCNQAFLQHKDGAHGVTRSYLAKPLHGSIPMNLSVPPALGSADEASADVISRGLFKQKLIKTAAPMKYPNEDSV